MFKSIVRLSFPLVLMATSLFSQPLSIGPDFTPRATSSDFGLGPVRTAVDLVQPATATGTVSLVHLYWSAPGCTNAIKIKFFRRSGNILTMVAERGPFSSTSSTDLTLLMSPPVPVQEGDLIGVARVANCGNPGTFTTSPNVCCRFAEFGSDVTGSVDLTSETRGASVLEIGGSGTGVEQIRGIIPVVGSTAGGSGSNFKTSLQLLYGAAGTTGTLSGKLVFHPAGTSGAASDVTIGYAVSAGQVIFYNDIVQTFNRSGLGSIDLITGLSDTVPVVIPRVFNDAGTAGTSGLTEDLLASPDQRIMSAGSTGFLVTPIDPSKTRFNIGVRTLFQGATLSVTLRDKDGVAIKTVSKSYLPMWFEQVDATTFLGGTAIGPNQSLAIAVSTGSVIVYGSTTDNTTNDPNIQFAKALFSTN